MAQSVLIDFFGHDAENHWVRHDSVTITNLDKGWQETIYWPDNRLVMQNNTGIYDIETQNCVSMQLFQNTPNPFIGSTDVLLKVEEAGTVILEIKDMSGRAIVETTYASYMQSGIHQFRINLSASGLYVMTVRQNGKTSSIKMLSKGGESGNGIDYKGMMEKPYQDTYTMVPQKSYIRAYTQNPFEYGDMMEYVGYATINGEACVSQSVSQLLPESVQIIILQFDEALVMPDVLPCPGTPTLTDIDGNVYNTVQIGQQCWMKENLRTTRYADSTEIPTGISDSYTLPYRYFPNNDESNVTDYGFLYNWSAVMHGGTSSDSEPSGVQGICPTGWHVPSRSEWTALTDYVGSMDVYVCGSNTAWIAKSLAATTGWNSSNNFCAVGNDMGANNATGFSALPAGTYSDGDYGTFGNTAGFWCSTELNTEWAKISVIANMGNYVSMNDSATDGTTKNVGASVRCVRD